MFSLFILAIDAKERQKWIDKLRTCSGSNAAEVVSRYHSIENNYFQFICSPSLYRHYRLREIVWLTRRRLQMNLKLVHPIDEIPSMIECFLSHENWQIFLSWRIYHHQQTLKEMREVIRCVEVNQREFVETIEVRIDYSILLSFSIDKTLVFFSSHYPTLIIYTLYQKYSWKSFLVIHMLWIILGYVATPFDISFVYQFLTRQLGHID